MVTGNEYFTFQNDKRVRDDVKRRGYYWTAEPLQEGIVNRFVSLFFF